MLRHTLATLAYRAGKVLREAPAHFADYRVAPDSRTPAEILAHMGDLMDWALGLARGQHVWHDATPLPWPLECDRFFAAIEALDAQLTAGPPVGWTAEQIFQGPIADALTYAGQLAMLRRLASSPVRGENYARAEIVAGRLRLDQPPPRVEFE